MKRTALRKKKPIERNKRPIVRKSELKRWKQQRLNQAETLLKLVARDRGFLVLDSGLKGAVNGFVDGHKVRPRARRRSTNTPTKQLDNLVTKIVIKRDGNRCARCGSESMLQSAHILKKGGIHAGMRFDPMNVIRLCRNCHLYKDGHFEIPDGSPGPTWFRDMFGDTYVQLLRSISAAKKGKQDKAAIRKELELELASMEGTCVQPSESSSVS